jgi:hypothetical protein
MNLRPNAKWFLACIATAVTTRATANFNPLDWTEVRPAALQREAVSADEPVGRAIVDAEAKEVWITGKDFLWRWHLASGSVARWDPPQAKHGLFQLIYASGGTLVGVDRRSAWLLRPAKKEWIKLDGTFPPACLPLGVSALPYNDGEKGLYLANNCGLFMILMTPRQLVRTVGSGVTVEAAASLMFARGPSQSVFLTAKDRALLTLEVDGPRVKESEIYRAKSKLRGVVSDGELVLAWSSQAIIVFDRNLRRKQVIPVLGQRKIRSLGVSSQRHVVEFSDGAIELLDLKTKRKYASPKGFYSSDFIDIFPDSQTFVLSSEVGMPRVFRFPL